MENKASLNHIFRTVWNQALGVMVAVAEIASSCGASAGPRARARNRLRAPGDSADNSNPCNVNLQPLALLVAVALMPALHSAQAQTLPQGGVAVHGSVSTNYSQANKLVVTTTNGAGTQHSATNWNSFNIGAGATTQINQPSAASMSINRVVTNTPSQLFGTLSSNGRVVLVNQSGIAVGAGALVDTAGFTASTVGMTTADAMAGRLRFAGGDFNTNAGALTVAGNVISRGGDVVLIAPSIDIAKTAVVEAQNGSVSLAAGQSVEITGRGLEGITLQVQAPADQALNLGSLKGDAVGIFAGTLKHSGLINAVLADGSGGKVVLRAKGNADVEGSAQILARGNAPGTKGGSVDVLGNVVWVGDESSIDVSGQTGGGQVRVGGDYKGQTADVPNAQVTWFGPQAQIKADALDAGNGGRVIVWANDTTRAHGSISAKGGANGGDGGFVETSGHRTLQTTAKVDTSAAVGTTGTWLLDPNTIRIVHSTSATDVSIQNGSSGIGDTRSPSQSDASESILTDFNINNALASNSVWIFTAGSGNGTGAGDIIFDASTNPVVVNNSSSAARNLTLTADGTVRFINGFTTFQSPNPASSLDVKLNGNFGADTAAGSVVHLNGGSGFGHVTATVDTTRTWVNNGLLSINGNASVQLNQNFGAATFFNATSGVVSVGSNSGWAFTSNSSSQDGIIVNNGVFNVTAGTAFEAEYSQGPLGITNVKDTFLNLQNASQIQGTVNLFPSSLGATVAATLNINEFHGNLANFNNTVFPNGGSVFVSGGATAQFLNVTAPQTAMHVGLSSSGTANFLGGNTVFNSFTVGPAGSVGLMDNTNLGIKGNDLVIPAVGVFGGNNGFYATGNITLPLLTNITLPGDLTLMASWDGVSAIGAGATQAATGGTIGLFSNISLFPNTLNLYAKGSISQGSGFINVANLTAATGGNITLTQNNFVSGEVNLTSTAGAINFNSTAGGFNLGGANAVGSLTITGAGSITADGSISGANVSITAPGGFSTIDQIISQNNLSINTSGGNGIIEQSGPFSDFTAPGITTLNAGTGDINLFSATNNLPNVNLTGSNVDLVTQGAMNVMSLVYGSGSNVYLVAGGQLTLPAGNIDTTAQVTLNSGGSLTTPGLVRGSTVILEGQTGITLNHNVFANLDLSLASASGVVNQLGGSISAPVAHASGSSVNLPASNAVDQIDGSSASGFTLNNATDLALNNITAGFIAITSGGAITRNTGMLDTSAADGTIALAANSIGTSGNAVLVNPGAGNVQLVAQSGGIYVQQAAGNMNLGQYSVSSIGTGQDIWLFGSPDNNSTINVSFSNFNANVLDDKVAVISPGANATVSLNGNALDALQVAIGATGPGGSVTVTSDGSAYAAPLGLDVFSLQGNVILNGTLHNASGFVRVTAGDSVSGSGGIRSYGNDVFVTANSGLTGPYGSFVPSGKGSINLGYIHSFGDDGLAGVSSTDAVGKNGGNVTLLVENGTLVSNYPNFVDVHVGQIYTYGGAGRSDFNGGGQAGGHGGTVNIVTPFLGGFAGDIKTDGGAGANSTVAGLDGGNGGHAGAVSIATTDNFLNFNGSVSTRGGNGGNAVLDGDSGASGGSGGNSADITFQSAGIGFNGVATFNMDGGAQGLDNAGVGGGNSSWTLFLNSSAGVQQFAGSSVSAAGQRVRFDVTGNISLTDPGNQMGEIDGQATGDIAVVGLYGIGDPGMRVGAGKNLSLTGLVGIPLQIQGTLEAIGGGAAGTVSLTGNSIEIKDPITTQNLNLAATGTGGITQFANQIHATGLTTITAPVGSTVSLDQLDNLFGQVNANLPGSSLTVATVGSLILGQINAAQLTVNALDSSITQWTNSPVNVTGLMQLDAGIGNISLMHSGNSIASLSVVSAGNLNLLAGAPLLLSGISVDGSVNIEASSIASNAGINAGFGNVVLFANGGVLDLSNTPVSAGLQVNLAAASGINVSNTVFTTGNPSGAAALAISTQGGPLLATGADISGVAGDWQTFLVNPTGGHQFGPFDPATNAAYRYVGFTGTQALPAGNGSIWFDSGILSSTLLGNITKTYDGTTALPGFAAALGNTAFVSAPAYLFSEASANLSAATAVLASPNAGSGIGVTMAPFNLDNKVFALNGTPTYGYTLSASGNIGTVTPVGVTVASLNGLREYDGTNIVNFNIFNVLGLVGGQTLTLSGFGTMADKNVGVNKLVNIGLPGQGGLALGDGTNGGLAINYTLTGGTHQATITPKDISSISGITASNRTYDGTNSAQLGAGSAVFNGMVINDLLTIATSTAGFSDKNAALGKTVDISNLSLGGTDAGNYNLVSTTAVTTASINKANIVGIVGITAANKTYDGTAAATVNTGSAIFNGMVTGDALTVATSSSGFTDKNAAFGKTVNISGLSLGGVDAGNYNLSSATATTTANIAKADITAVTGITTANKTYDATTVASINTAGAVLVGKVAGDLVQLGAGAIGTFADKNAGPGKTVTVTGIALAGTDVGNYNLVSNTATSSANVAKADITTVTGILADNKTYDGTIAATLNSGAAVLNGQVSGDVLTVGSALGSFGNKSAGLAKTVGISGIALGGADAGNYNLLSTNASATADIAKASITAVNGITANDKIYDGNPSAVLNTGAALIAGLVLGDNVAVATANGAFADRNVGAGKTVTIGNITLAGPDSGNYTTGSFTSTSTASITPLAQVNWTGGSSGQWGVAGNWAGNALPDGNNVRAVNIPAGSQVTFDSSVGLTQLQNINSLGGINITSGNLQVSDTLKTRFYDQSGGLLSGAGKLQVTDGFTKAGGLINMGGLVDINQTNGNLVVGGMAGGNILLSALNGGIAQTGPIATSGVLGAHSAQAMVLNAANNNLDGVVLLADSGNVELTNVGAIKLIDVAAKTGSIIVKNTGGLVTEGKVLAPKGKILIVTNSPLTVLAGSQVAASGDVDLIATNLTSSGDMLINGQVTSGGNINLGAANNLTQNGQLLAVGGINAIAGGAMTFGPLAISSGSPVNYRANGASVLPPPGSLAEVLARSSGTGGFINSFLNKFEEELESRQVAKNDTPGKKKKDDITVEGETCRP